MKRLAWLVCAGAAALAFCVPTFAQDEPEDAVAERQSMDAYTSIEDGQPGGPGEFEIRLDTAWEKESGEEENEFPVEYELKYTGKGNDFWKNSKWSLTQGAELGNGSVDGNGDIELGWQQRWVSQEDHFATFGTLLSFRLPTGDDSSGVDTTLTLILDKDLGPGTIYLSSWVTSAHGHNNLEEDDHHWPFWWWRHDDEAELRRTQWGAQLGYKWQLADKFALIGNYVLKSSEEDGEDSINQLELAGEYHATDSLTIGPGIVIGLDDHEETPDFGVGIRFTYAF